MDRRTESRMDPKREDAWICAAIVSSEGTAVREAMAEEALPSAELAASADMFPGS